MKGQHNNHQSTNSGAHNNGTNNQNVQSASNRGNMNNSYRGRGQYGL